MSLRQAEGSHPASRVNRWEQAQYDAVCCIPRARARNIPINSLMSRLAEVGPKDRPVVLYCASGARSGVGRQLLLAAGYADAVNAGGLEDMPG